MIKKLLIAVLASLTLIACKSPAAPEQPEETAPAETATAETAPEVTETAEPTAEEQPQAPAEQTPEAEQVTETAEPFQGLTVEENAVYEVPEDTEIVIN